VRPPAGGRAHRRVCDAVYGQSPNVGSLIIEPPR
jgi:hypothetical protein